MVEQDGASPETGGELAHEFLAEVGSRIRALRADRSLTVQQLADHSQISRRLLTQIELGQANPSLVTITRIARQLGVDFTDLLGAPPTETPIEVTDPGDHTLVWSSEAGSTAHLLAATAGSRSADIWRWRLVPGDTYRGHADPAGSQELFYVLKGRLILTADNQRMIVPGGSSARLRSDRPYTYSASGDSTAEFIRTVALTR